MRYPVTLESRAADGLSVDLSVAGLLTDEQPASSYGLPVLVADPAYEADTERRIASLVAVGQSPQEAAAMLATVRLRLSPGVAYGPGDLPGYVLDVLPLPVPPEEWTPEALADLNHRYFGLQDDAARQADYVRERARAAGWTLRPLAREAGN